MVKLRLKRLGSKKAPTYRIVAADSRSPRDGRIIDTVGLIVIVNFTPYISFPSEVSIFPSSFISTIII